MQINLRDYEEKRVQSEHIFRRDQCQKVAETSLATITAEIENIAAEAGAKSTKPSMISSTR